MKMKSLKNIAILFAVITSAVAFSACNRGYGCPNNFSIETTQSLNVFHHQQNHLE